MRKISILTSILLVAIAAHAQEQSGLIKTEKGILVVWNEPGNYYTMEIKGERIEPTQRPLWFKVDGKFFQIATVEKKQFEKSGTADNRSVLTAHMAWEADYIGGLLKSKITPTSSTVKLPNGYEALSGAFDMPKISDQQTARRQLYLAVVKRDHVMMLNSPVEGADDEKTIAKLLSDALSTLKSTEKPLPLAAAAEMVKKGTQ
jgi:hypothetical protein